VNGMKKFKVYFVPNKTFRMKSILCTKLKDAKWTFFLINKYFKTVYFGLSKNISVSVGQMCLAAEGTLRHGRTVKK
jgi:hypothetical protein